MLLQPRQQRQEEQPMRNNRQYGFGAVEGLVIVVFIAVIGTLGYVFVRNMNAKTAKTTTTQSAATSTAIPKTAAEAKTDATQVKKDLDAVNVDSSLDTSAIDAALQ